MRIIFMIILLIKLSVALGQNDAFSNDPRNSGTLDAYDLSGKAIPTSKEAGVEGTPMFTDQFVPGSVTFNNGKKYNGTLNLSLVDNQLHFKKDSMELLFAVPVNDFVLNVDDKGNTKPVHFNSGYPAIGTNTTKSFYEVLSTGANVQLLKYTYKVIEEIYHYGGPAQKSYALRENLFVYDVTNNKMFEVGRNINALKKSLPAFALAIDRYTAQKKVNFKHEEDIIALTEAINTKPEGR